MVLDKLADESYDSRSRRTNTFSDATDRVRYSWSKLLFHKNKSGVQAIHFSSNVTARRTNEDNPLNHSQEHVGLFYTLPEPESNKLFAYGGFPKPFKKNSITFAETCVMIREPALEVINYLKNANFKRPAVRYVLYGKKGCGKSISLVHILHFAHRNKFFLLHVPWAWDWFRNNRTDVSKSPMIPDLVDLPVLSATWLKHFQSQNSELLAEETVKTSQDYVWNQRETTPIGSNLSELVIHGINRIKYAGGCVAAIVKELKIAASQGNADNTAAKSSEETVVSDFTLLDDTITHFLFTLASHVIRCKVLVAIDGLNALFGQESNYKTEDKIKVTPNMVTLTHAFLEATKQDWTNGAVVVTVDQRAGREHLLESHLPLYLIGRKGFEHLDPFITVNVPEFTDVELHSMLDYYEDRKWIQRKGGRDELSFLSKKNPFQLMVLSNPL